MWTFCFRNTDIQLAHVFVTMDGKGASITLWRPWNRAIGRLQNGFIDEGNQLENVDIGAIPRGVVVLDQGVEGLLNAIGGVGQVVAVDPGIVDIVFAVDADVVGMICQNLQQCHQILRNHALQVSHGEMRQINYSKQLEKNEEELRDNDFHINWWFDLLSANSPRHPNADLEIWCM